MTCPRGTKPRRLHPRPTKRTKTTGPVATEAQPARKILERHIEAVGGKKALEQIASAEVSGRITTDDESSGVFVQKTTRPNLFYVSMSWRDSSTRAGFNGRAAWQWDAVDGLRTLYGHDASRLRAEAGYANTRLVLSEKLSEVFLTTPGQVRGRPVVVLTAFTPDGTKRTLSFDAATYLLVKDEQQTDAGVEERFYDDYRRVGQVMEPHRIEWRRNGETLRIDIERVVHNGAIDSATFDAPAPAVAPPLDLDAVLAAAGTSFSGSTANALIPAVLPHRIARGVVHRIGRPVHQVREPARQPAGSRTS